MRSRLYLGQVMHARLEPVEHAFRYPAFAFALDVDELPELDRELRLFGHGRRDLRGHIAIVTQEGYVGPQGSTVRQLHDPAQQPWGRDWSVNSLLIRLPRRLHNGRFRFVKRQGL